MANLSMAASDVILDGDFLYVAGGGSGLVILDVSDPQRPLLLSSTQTLESAEVKGVDGARAYVGGRGLLTILDIEDLSAPTILGEFQFDRFTTIDDVVAHGDFAFLNLGRDGIATIDASDPVAPEQVYSHSFTGDPTALQIQGNYLFATSSIGTLWTYRIENPRAMGIFTFDQTIEDAYDMAIRDGLAYVCEREYGVEVIDVSDPFHITSLGVVDTVRPVTQVTIIDDLMYLMGSETSVYDLSADPLEPTLVGTFDATPRAIARTGDIGFFANSVLGVQIFDLSSLDKPVPLATFDAPTTSTDIAVSGGFAYVLDESLSSLHCIDLADPTHPRPLRTIDTLRKPVRVVTANGLLYVLDMYDGLLIYDVSAPSDPQLIGALATSDMALDLCVEGDLAYIAAFRDGLLIADVSDPSQPVVIGRYETGDRANHVTLSDGRAYISVNSVGMWILDIADPTAPSFLGTAPYAGNPTDVKVRDGYAYVMNGGSAVSVLDVRIPALVFEIAEFSFSGGGGSDLVLVGDTAYVASRSLGLTMVDVSLPYTPVLRRNYRQELDDLLALEVVDGVAYGANGRYGLRVYDIRDCYNPADRDFDGSVTSRDLASILAAWGTEDGDLNGDGATDSEDLAFLLALWD